MRNASGHQGKNERQQKPKKGKRTTYIQHFLTCNSGVSESFTWSSCKTFMAKKIMYKKSVLHVQSSFLPRKN